MAGRRRWKRRRKVRPPKHGKTGVNPNIDNPGGGQQYSSELPNSNGTNVNSTRMNPRHRRTRHSHGHTHQKPGYCAGVGDSNSCPETFCSEQAFHDCWADGYCCTQGDMTYQDYLQWGATYANILPESVCRQHTINNPWGGCYWVESRPIRHNHRHRHPHGQHIGHFTPPVNQCPEFGTPLGNGVSMGVSCAGEQGWLNCDGQPVPPGYMGCDHDPDPLGGMEGCSCHGTWDQALFQYVDGCCVAE